MTSSYSRTAAAALVVLMAACDHSPVALDAPPADVSPRLAHALGPAGPTGPFIPLTARDLEGGRLPVLPLPESRRALRFQSDAAQQLAAQPAGFKLVQVRVDHPGARGQGPIVDNFADALARVADGGTIRVYPGTHIVDAVEIDRSVTIEGTGGRPVVRNDGAPYSLRISQLAHGSVTIRGLDFQLQPGSRSSIQAIGEYADVRVDDCSFDVNNATAGIDVGTNLTGNGRVTVTRSTFRNGALGVFAWSGGVLDVSGSSFGPHGFRAIQYQGGHGVAENNDVEQCGVNGCVAVILGAEADVRGNRLRQTRTDVNGFNHHVVLYASDGRGRVEDNHFDGCGHGQCFLAISRAHVEVVGNTFTIDPAHMTRIAISVSDGSIGSAPDFASRAPTVIATDNVIRAPGAAVGNRHDPDSYALRVAALLVENGGILRAYRNTAENADVGVLVSEFNPGGVSGSTGGRLEGGDNAFDLVRLAVGLWGASTADFRSTDFTDYVHPLFEGGRDQPSDLTCNWWGAAAGPSNMDPSVDPALYTPWATTPVAGSSTTTCAGGL
jgi:hypothetical protein